LRDAELRRAVDAAEGVFVVEGARSVAQLLNSEWSLLSLLLRPERVDAMAEAVDGFERRGAPVYVAEAAVFNRVAGFPVHRGVLALAGRRPDPDPMSVLAGVDTAVVVEAVNDHENLGAIFRNAAALGGGAVLLDPRCCDPLYRRVVRVSVGHVLRMPFTRLEPWPAALRSLAGWGFSVVALDPQAPEPLHDLQRHGRLALLVGGEGPGLSEAARQAADRRVRIPMAAGVDSLNVATAVAIALHHLARP
jgi:tRNA G18 (ribose-2'-O)-methylase SpoU